MRPDRPQLDNARLRRPLPDHEALLSTVLSVGSELGAGADNGNNTAILQALRLGAANSLNQTGQQVVRRNLNIQPTLTIRPGFPVRVIVNRDLVLEPYRG
jgi:type IV secretion system protein VirB10